MKSSVVRFVVRSFVFLAISLAAACTSGGDTTGPITTQSIEVSVAPTSVSLDRGVSKSVTLTITRHGGYDGPVTVVLKNPPLGLQTTSVIIPSGSTVGTINLLAALTAPSGSYSLILSATGSGVDAATTNLMVDVAIPVGNPGIIPAGTLVTQGPNGLYLIATNGSNLRQIYFAEGADDLAPQWNPAGTEVVFHTRFSNNQTLMIVDLNGQARFQNPGIPGVAEQFWPEYSADGAWIYFQAWPTNGFNYQIWRVRANGTGAERISSMSELRSAEAPSPSPNGQEVAYTLRPGEPTGFDLVVQNLATGQVRKLGAGFGVRWSPDGQWLAFVDGLDLVVQKPDGTQRRVLNPGVGYRTGLSWTRDSKAVFAREEGIGGTIDVVMIDGSGYSAIAGTSNLRQPAYKP